MNAQARSLRWARLNWGAKARIAFYRRLAAYVGNGKRPVDALRDLVGQTGRDSAAHRVALSNILRAVANGQTMADALQGWSPDTERALIHAGERAGRLPQALLACCDLNGLSGRLLKRIVGELFEPGIMLVLGGYLAYITGTQMVPAMQGLMPPENWPLTARLLLPFGAMASSALTLWVLLACALLVALILVTLPSFTGPVRRRLEWLPPWSIYRKLQAFAWIPAFCNLLEAGVPVAEALRLQAQHATPWLRERLQSARSQVQGGARLGDAFRLSAQGFPDPSLIDDISAFGQFHNFPQLLRSLGRDWAEETEVRVMATIRVFGLIANIAVNAMILMTVMGMMALQNLLVSSAH